MLAEFDLIRRYLMPSQKRLATDGVALGSGDDAALLIPQAGHQLAVSVDTSVVNVHFPHDAPSFAIGHRALAVALSDLAAMGADARWCFMALTLDQRTFSNDTAIHSWMAGFGQGFHGLCQRHAAILAGGDVTSGELAVGVTVMGELPAGRALTRAGARPGDVIAVTGELGGGGGGLALWKRGERDLEHPLLRRYLLPEPRLAAGVALRGLASAAMDISDGLLADLGHLREASGVGAILDKEALPLAEGLEGALGREDAQQAALSGGDDYELLVTLAPGDVAHAQHQLSEQGLALTVIGQCTEALGVQGIAPAHHAGWQHFNEGTP
ncbi:thiamine-phosphate kinase [Vreelandella populi]|uniref:Thiamine-monophosphate kinase n=1 Tax=Vreelandella populi TaxID=2498858 RepID=A0A433LBQ5_9GAMM|nr:thiamine-phosphate kinase [Halomonas populi]RUR42328.1 thiamine-phosphate kinase [Halomonas populi]RUR46065.1 thiamine-phosphate kinase [Halomonas populi]